MEPQLIVEFLHLIFCSLKKPFFLKFYFYLNKFTVRVLKSVQFYGLGMKIIPSLASTQNRKYGRPYFWAISSVGFHMNWVTQTDIYTARLESITFLQLNGDLFGSKFPPFYIPKSVSVWQKATWAAVDFPFSDLWTLNNHCHVSN